jgi:hypothetical protein
VALSLVEFLGGLVVMLPASRAPPHGIGRLNEASARAAAISEAAAAGTIALVFAPYAVLLSSSAHCSSPR